MPHKHMVIRKPWSKYLPALS